MNGVWQALRNGAGAIVDAILPLRPRSARSKALRIEDVPLCVSTHELLGTKITTLMDYRRQETQDLIQSLKYDGGTHAAHICASVLAEYLLEEIANARNFSTKRILLVPVPLHKTRERERGFNQIALMLRSLPPEFTNGSLSSLGTAALTRSRETAQQTRLSRSERLENVAGAFAVTSPVHVQNTHIFLIDDVATTGATLVNAATALRRAGAQVTLLALARA